MTTGFKTSFFFHIIILMLLSVDVFFSKKITQQEIITVVDLVKVAKKTNLPNKKPPLHKSKKKSELDDFLKKIESQPISRNLTKSKKPKTKQTNYSQIEKDDSVPLSISELAYIRLKITNNFSNPILYKFDPNQIVVELKLELKIDGTIQTISVLNSSQYQKKDSLVFDSISNNLISACYKAEPFDMLPNKSYKGKYGWKTLVISFDAKNLM